MDPASVATLIEQQYSGLLALLRRKIRASECAEDALNQALATSLEHYQAGRISDPAQIAGYVFQVALNHLRNHRRKMGERLDRRADPEDLDNMAREADDDAVDRGRLADEVRRILGALPTPRDREVVKRFYLEEDEKEAICRDLGISPLHFDKVIFRARQRMRKLLEEKGFKKTDFFSFLAMCFA